MNRDYIEYRLVEFLRTLSGDAALNVHTELLEEGIVDSLTMMDILVFIESQFQARLDFADLNARAFQSPASLAEMICQRLTPKPATCSRASEWQAAVELQAAVE